MYCNNCGSAIAGDDRVCARCGRSTITGRADVAARTRVAGHIQLLAIFWFVIAAFWVIPAVIMLVFSSIAGGHPDLPEPLAAFVAHGLFVLLAVGFMLAAAVSFVTGWGLYKVAPWGRTLALVMAFLGIFHPPFGTALGIYTLVVLLPSPAADEYRRMSAAAEHSEHAAA